MLKIILLSLSLTSMPTLANDNMNTNTDPEPFKETLQKELTNRATARYAIAAITEQSLAPAPKLFWDSYARLEILNQDRYAAVAAELQLEPGTLSAWLKGRSAAIYFRFAPQRMINTMAQATQTYYQQLMTASDKVVARHAVFYQYVLDQEKAQVEAFGLAAAGNYGDASKHLDAFIQAHQPEPQKQ